MNRFPSIHERRRQAPLHFWAKADNARFTAHALWTLPDPGQEKRARQINYNGNPAIATEEAFYREASVALELIIKAVIAQRVEIGIAMRHVVKVRATHDLVSLWKDAQLPALSSGDAHRLMIAKQTLYWAGRYAAPLKDEDFEKEKSDMASLEDRLPFGTSNIFIITPRSFSWEDFDRIYQIAAESLSRMREEADL